jgi:hypothetical protein
MKKFRKYITYFFILATFILKGQPTGYTNVGSTAFSGSDGGTISEVGNGNNWVGATRTTSFNDFEFTSTKWTGSSTGGTAGAIIFRWTNSSNFYAITYHNAGHRRVIAIKKNNLDNSNTTGALASLDVGSNVAIKVRVVGDSIKVDIGNNGSWEMAVKDGSHSSGSIGFMKNGRWDDGVKWETATWTQVVSCTVGAASSSPTVCVNTELINITHTTTEVTAITSSSSLPVGVTASYASNTVTISGTPTEIGIFNYTITLNGCGTATATGTITVEECITLPVDLIYFKGEQKDTLINLNWETASEINSDYFEILHSRDNINFETIGKVNTAGNSNVSEKYNLPHSYPEHGVNYYKLRECDVDGNYSDYKSIFVEFKIIRQAYDFIIYPNPNNNVSVNLKTNYIGEINMQIFDLEGKIVYHGLINVTNQKVNLIENINLRPGVYNILINPSNNYFSIKHIKLIIRH